MRVRCDECPAAVLLKPGQMTPVLCRACEARSEAEFFAMAERDGQDTRNWPRFYSPRTSKH